MVDQMVRPVVDNMRQAMSTDPQFVALRNENPKFGPLFDDFMASEFEHSLATTKAAMPALIDAMARAYARRFTIEQLTAISAFFDTPAGRAFVDQSMTIMSDPDILAVQRKMIAEAVTGLQKRAETFAGKVVEAAGKDD
ncbi:DUF2059 domain-containing protein [Sphingomonas psychrotolerans]|uniref:DUF2059 domain-containing protein n=1 Tax=Sphingomonas psychrotolerans TaxID=1327635 RepID=A0ABU3N911_9SPHN|nr:DUF2059 domain-containing protein [Sphingomonas psychrotolerans]MDT8760359.1 DUF2059 domain-containing protein [Sphingomonas psychrotolerans]